jgi:hypothetical protein
MKTPKSLNNPVNPAVMKLRTLTPEQVVRIDEVLTSLGDYGEVHLIKQKGELRYINRVESFKAWSDKLT